MAFSAFIPADRMKEANEALDLLGFGPQNFSVGIKSAGATMADTAALHCGNVTGFQDAVAALGYATIDDGTAIVDGKEVQTTTDFKTACTKAGLTWEQWDGKSTLIMKDETRVIDGKTWVSLIDGNIWKPPTAWREVVATGYPAWIAPTGAHDAYQIGNKVSYKGANYESTMANGVWAPDVYGWKVIP